MKSKAQKNVIARKNAEAKLFRKHKIEIPFPQQDLWLRNAEVLRMQQ